MKKNDYIKPEIQVLPIDIEVLLGPGASSFDNDGDGIPDQKDIPIIDDDDFEIN